MDPQLEWNDLSLILAIGRAESLSGAARTVGQTHSTVFRRINAVEERTGVRFFDRFRTGYVPTDAGRLAMTAAERIEGEVTALGREVLGRDGRLTGPIRVTCPEVFADGHAVRIAGDFTRLHPGIRIDVIPARASLDLDKREAEVAIRATSSAPEGAWGRKVCDFANTFYASRDYAEAHRGATPEELRFVLIEGVSHWLVPLFFPDAETAMEHVVFQSPQVRAVQNACAAGMGIAGLPTFSGDADPRLVRVAVPVAAYTMELWVLTHPDLRGTARVRALMAHLYEDLAAHRALFEGDAPGAETMALVDVTRLRG